MTARTPPSVLRIHPHDDVAVALVDLPAQSSVTIDAQHIQLRAAIGRGHKLALRTLLTGQAIHKYGWPIGRATRDIQIGDHVHSHNVSTNLHGTDFDVQLQSHLAKHEQVQGRFAGYRRADGRVGTRNELWVLCTVGCVANTAQRLARHAQSQYGQQDNMDGAFAFTHQFGCSQLGDDNLRTRHVLAALACHPNAGGVLIVGLGCESNQLDALLAEIPEARRSRVRAFATQKTQDEFATGMQLIEELMTQMRDDQRSECPISDLVLGVKCGGSDGLSGITANPLVGRMTDRVTAGGGRAVLTEVPEIFGAESVLLSRAANAQVARTMTQLFHDFRDYFVQNHQPVHENPSPGNIAGGITTLEEKSLGAVQKGGAALVTDVIRYGDQVQLPGLTLLEAPGNDGISSTALVAAGCTVLLFTTGRGTPLGFPAPTLKISSNSTLARQKPHWIDFDAGQLLNGNPANELADDLWQVVLATASGQLTASERNEERHIALWKHGVTL